MEHSLLKKLILTVLAGCMFWMLTQGVFAAIQIPDTLRPANLPDWDVAGTVDPDHPETAATQTVILFVGNMVSQVLLFMATIAIVFVIFSGANYIFAFGKDERIERGKRGLFWSLMGLIIVLLSYSIVQGVISVILQVDSSVG
jgi:hypothetical protein